jgi:hypothetical protein
MPCKKRELAPDAKPAAAENCPSTQSLKGFERFYQFI